MHHLRNASCVLLFCGLAAAQTNTAHPIDNSSFGISQNIPFAGDNTVWDEARSQFLFSAPFLPSTGGAILSFELVPSRAGTTFYERFEIWMDHTTNSTLSRTFANNLTNPQLVFQQSPGSIAWTSGGWHTIQLSTPFIYDGVRNLVMEVRKKIDRPNNPPTASVSHGVLTWPRRSDLPTPIWTWGSYGSGAVDAPVAATTYSTQVLMRFQWAAARTLTIDSTRNSGQNYFHLGATLSVTANGMPGEFVLDAIDVGLNPAGVPLPALANGLVWLANPVIAFIGPLDPMGQAVTSLAIPNNGGLVGVRGYYQGVTAGAAFNLTNVVDFVIEP